MTIDSSNYIENIYSKLEDKILLHQIYKPSLETSQYRINISPENESMQVSHLLMKKNQKFKAHKHLLFDRNMPIAQESWVVISGKVKVFYYDLDDELLTTQEIISGECSITYRGGHHYESLTDNTIVYEFKTGPYFGVEKDKVFLNSKN